jgi:hypothetical protein
MFWVEYFDRARIFSLGPPGRRQRRVRRASWLRSSTRRPRSPARRARRPRLPGRDDLRTRVEDAATGRLPQVDTDAVRRYAGTARVVGALSSDAAVAAVAEDRHRRPSPRPPRYSWPRSGRRPPRSRRALLAPHRRRRCRTQLPVTMGYCRTRAFVTQLPRCTHYCHHQTTTRQARALSQRWLAHARRRR